MVHSYPVAQEAGEGLAEPAGKTEPAYRLADEVPLGPACYLGAGERLGSLDRRLLSEMDGINRAQPFGYELGQGVMDESPGIAVVERHGTLGRGHDGGRAPGAPLEIGDETGDVPQRGRHQHELGAAHLDERHLPGPPAVGVGIKMELVHDDLVDGGGLTKTQGDVGQDLGRAADHRRPGVDGGVAREHADVVHPELGAKLEELLRHQSLDGGGVPRSFGAGQGGQMGTQGDEALA